MAKNTITIVFNANHSPRKKGEVVTFTGPQERKVAEWYLANGMATECGCDKKANGEGCTGCDELAKAAKEQKPDNGTENESTGTEVDVEVENEDIEIGTGTELIDADTEGLKATEVIELIEKMGTVEEVEDALASETRKTVITAGNKKIEELKAAQK
jgi:hypothetical protein